MKGGVTNARRCAAIGTEGRITDTIIAGPIRTEGRVANLAITGASPAVQIAVSIGRRTSTNNHYRGYKSDFFHIKTLTIRFMNQLVSDLSMPNRPIKTVQRDRYQQQG